MKGLSGHTQYMITLFALLVHYGNSSMGIGISNLYVYYIVEACQMAK